MRRFKAYKDQLNWNRCVKAMAEYLECTLQEAEDFMLAQPAIMRVMPKELDADNPVYKETVPPTKRT